MLKTVLLVGVALVLLGAGWIAYSWWRFSSKIDAEIAALQTAARPSGETVTEVRLAELPEPVARHLRQAGAVGKPIPRLVRLTQTGRIRNSETAGWLSFEAREIYSLDPPGFVWRAAFPSAAMPVVFGRDHYLAGDGAISIRALGTLPMAEAEGAPEMNHAGLMRYLNELMWFPEAYAGRNLTWTAIDETSAEVSLTDHGITATARLVFDDDGRFVTFIAERFDTNSGAMQTWETPISAHARFDDMTLPSKGAALYRLETGPFTYIELEVTGVTRE